MDIMFSGRCCLKMSHIPGQVHQYIGTFIQPLIHFYSFN